jgi:hypothetical protein
VEWDSIVEEKEGEVKADDSIEYVTVLKSFVENERYRESKAKNRPNQASNTQNHTKKQEKALYMALHAKYGRGTPSPAAAGGGTNPSTKKKGWGPVPAGKTIPRPPFKCYTCGDLTHNRFSCPHKNKGQTGEGKKAQEAIKEYKEKCDKIGEAYGARKVRVGQANSEIAQPSESDNAITIRDEDWDHLDKDFNKDDWDIADSGATAIFKTDVEGMVGLHKPHINYEVEGAHGHRTAITLDGDYKLLPEFPALPASIAPGLKQNLIGMHVVADTWAHTC